MLLHTVPPVFVPRIPPMATIEALAGEPSLFSCSPQAVDAMGGPISKEILQCIYSEYPGRIRDAMEAGLNPIIDVRVHRLMPGMYPAIPGWHCDAVPRDDYFGQPVFSRINPAAFHVACTISTHEKGVSLTEYHTLPLRLELDDNVNPIYKDMHRIMETDHGVFNRRCAKDGELVLFTPRTPHRATATINRGWRLFFRFSMYHKPPISNAVVSQQQVYLLSEDNGW